MNKYNPPLNKYDQPFAKLTAEQSRELAAQINGGIGMGKRPPKEEEKTDSGKTE